MAEIKSYPIGTPSLDDYLLGTEGPNSEANGSTRNYTISDIKDIIGSGSQGSQGPIGPAGAAGAAGNDGAQGAAGADGTSISILGDVANCSGLPTVGNTVGDVYILDADDPGCSYGAGLAGDGYTWTAGLTWLNIGPLRGPQGIQGATGPQGETGPEGPQGPQGGTGAVGNGINSTTGGYYTAGGIPIIPGDPIPADAQYKVRFDYTDLSTFLTDDIRGADGALNPQYTKWIIEDNAGTNEDIFSGDKLKISGTSNEITTAVDVIAGGYDLEVGLSDFGAGATDYGSNAAVPTSIVSSLSIDSKGRASVATSAATSSFVRNTSDNFGSVNAVQQIITLTDAEYLAITPDNSTLYIIVG